MRFELNREIFVELLGNVAQVLPSRTTNPVLENILLEVVAGNLIITGSDGDTVIKKEILLEGESEEGKVALKGKKLLELIRESDHPTVEISWVDGKVKVVSGGLKAYLVSFPTEDFPPLPSIPQETIIEFPGDVLFEMFDRCSFAVSKDESRPALTGINWEIYKNESRMVATDSYRLAYISRKIKSQTRAKVLLTPKVLNLLPRVEDKIKIFLGSSMVGFQIEGTTVLSRMIEGPYPDYEKVIPKEYPYRAILERSSFIAMVRRAGVIAHPLGKQIEIEFTPEAVKVKAENQEVGGSEEEMGCKYKGETMRIGFNCGYLSEILNHIPTEEVAVEFSTPMTPVVFKPVDIKPEEEEIFILMPLRLD